MNESIIQTNSYDCGLFVLNDILQLMCKPEFDFSRCYSHRLERIDLLHIFLNNVTEFNLNEFIRQCCIESNEVDKLSKYIYDVNQNRMDFEMSSSSNPGLVLSPDKSNNIASFPESVVKSGLMMTRSMKRNAIGSNGHNHRTKHEKVDNG